MKTVEVVKNNDIDVLVKQIYDKEPILEIVLKEIRKNSLLSHSQKKTLIHLAQKHDVLLNKAKAKAVRLLKHKEKASQRTDYRVLYERCRKELERLKAELDKLEKICKQRIVLVKGTYIKPYYKAKEDMHVLLDTELPQILLMMALGG